MYKHHHDTLQCHTIVPPSRNIGKLHPHPKNEPSQITYKKRVTAEEDGIETKKHDELKIYIHVQKTNIKRRNIKQKNESINCHRKPKFRTILSNINRNSASGINDDNCRKKNNSTHKQQQGTAVKRRRQTQQPTTANQKCQSEEQPTTGTTENTTTSLTSEYRDEHQTTKREGTRSSRTTTTPDSAKCNKKTDMIKRVGIHTGTAGPAKKYRTKCDKN